MSMKIKVNTLHRKQPTLRCFEDALNHTKGEPHQILLLIQIESNEALKLRVAFAVLAIQPVNHDELQVLDLRFW